MTGVSGAGAAGCVQCAAGSFAAANSASCTPCAAGSASTAPGATSCAVCKEGTFAAGTNNVLCSACPPGSFQDQQGQGACIPCAAGAFCIAGAIAAPAPGSCPAGYYCPGGGVAPQQCPAGTWRSATGGTLLADCTLCVAPLYSSVVGATSSATCTAFASTQLLLLRGGEGPGGSCPDGTIQAALTAACGRAAPIFLDAIDVSTYIFSPAAAPIPGVTLAANDAYKTGHMTQCADKSCLSFPAGTDPVGTPNTGATAITYTYGGFLFPGTRAIVRITAGQTVDTSTRFSATDYPGLPTAACSFDGSAFWVVGTAGAPVIGYLPFGNQPGTFQAASNAAAQALPYANAFSGCAIVGSSIAPNTAGRAMYLPRTSGAFGYIDAATDTTVNWAAPGTIAITANPTYNGGPYDARIIVANAAGNKFWIANQFASGLGIYYGTVVTAALAVVSGVTATGMALSPAEDFLYYSRQSGIFFISASCASACTSTQITQAVLPAFSEWRGVGFVNRPLQQCPAGTFSLVPPAIGGQCFPCPAGSASSVAGLIGIGCTACLAGSYSLAGATSCTQCPAGTASSVGAAASEAACVSCPLGFSSSAGAANTWWT